MKQIDIQFAAGSAAQKTFPVFYAIESKEEGCTKIFRCIVALPQSQMPSWLPSDQFDLIAHVRDGIQLIDYNASGNTLSRTFEADSFLYKVYTEIFFLEFGVSRRKLAAC